jgi:hypothetical protein
MHDISLQSQNSNNLPVSCQSTGRSIPKPVQPNPGDPKVNLLNICIDFINSVPRIHEPHNFLSKEHQILEYQTLQLQLPRRTGKTSTIKALYHLLPSAEIVCPTLIMSKQYGVAIHEASFLNQTNFPYPIRPTIHYLLLDELPVKHEHLKHPAITQETIIVSLSTPR